MRPVLTAPESKAVEPLGRAGEVGLAEVARPSRRPVGGVGQAVAELEHPPLLVRRELRRGQPRVGEQPPEVVSGVREVGAGGGRAKAGVDPAEEDVQAGREDVGDG